VGEAAGLAADPRNVPAMRVGVLGHGFVTWGGGVGFLAIVTHALVAADPNVEVHVVLPLGRGGRRSIGDRMLRWITGREKTAELPRPEDAPALDAFAGLKDRVTLHSIDYGDDALRDTLRAAAIDAAIPALDPLSPSIGMPWVGYIYDFQHRYLPGLFTEEEIRRRDHAFRTMTTIAPAVVVNSRKVRSDIATFIPEATAKIFAMPFAPFLDERSAAAIEPGAPEVTSPYFIICNQFWVHKDHATAFRAFAEVARDHPRVRLLCTGSPDDHRAPDHFRALVAEIDGLGLGSRVELLGMVPKSQQLRLVRGALALVQPTLFEGGPGGGAVYDAVGSGVPALVSDIEVNREVDCGDVRFFEAGDPDALARLMREALLRAPVPRPSRAELLVAGQERLARCGSVLLEALAYAREAQRT